MKTILKTLVTFSLSLILFGCSEEIEPQDTGVLRFKMINPVAEKFLKKKRDNPDLTGEITETITVSLNFCIGDVWVSKNEVKEGEKDKPEDWVRITSFTNTEHKLFEDYYFPDVDIPAGDYKSVHITFRNLFYRYAVLASDSSVRYELLETMGSYKDTCSLEDTSWVSPNTNYFSVNGNHEIKDGTYHLEDGLEGEKLTGFTIEPNKTAIVSWRLGAGATEPCTTYLHDKNGNRKWDCGIDEMSFDCPPEVKYMWDFVVDYE